MDRHIKQLRTRFNNSTEMAREVIGEVFALEEMFAVGEPIPKSYNQHVLMNEPWVGFYELHVADDILLVHVINETKAVVRFVGLYTHDMLRTGRIE
jgi:mRNA-degrading endonuclease YafQ of YafQ-DinJ toxin-antitoxin module